MDINIPVDNNKKYEIMKVVLPFLKDILTQGSINVDSLKLNNMSYVDESENDVEGIIKRNYVDKVYPYIEKSEYIFENYLVNYVFQNLIPLNAESLTEQFYRMIFNYSFIVSLLCVRCIDEVEVTDDAIVEVIYLFTRSIMHSQEKIKVIEDEFKRNNLYSLAYITLMVK